jgi:N-acetylmuramoyl-L-alanine amidase
MLSRFFASLSNFLSSIFGGQRTPPTKPPVDTADTHLETTVQDAQEVPDETEDVVLETDVDLTPIEEGSVSEVPTEDPVVTTPEPPVVEPEEDNEPPVVVVTADPTVVIIEDTDGPPTKPEIDPTPQHKQRYLWCLDNGHGKLQAGKRSVIFDDGKTQFLEYEFNRDVVEKIMAKLDEIGVAYFDVVPDVDVVGSFLQGRVKRANNKISPLKKIFVSVHANAGPTSSDGWGSTTGIETWYHKNSRKGKKVAAIFQKELIDEMGWKNRHLKSSAITDLYVLRETWMPAILTENGFFTNKNQARDLMKNAVRQKIADAHVAAIMEIERKGI